jgi:hypothetical protein
MIIEENYKKPGYRSLPYSRLPIQLHKQLVTMKMCMEKIMEARHLKKD